jgi:Domain of Unknown Function (DUF928)
MNKIFFKISLIFAAISVLTVTVVNLPFQSIIVEALSATVGRFKPPPPPKNRGILGNRTGSASRTLEKDPTLRDPRNDGKYPRVTAIVPEYSETKGEEPKSTLTKVWGLTTSEYPDFWFYTPYSKASIDKISFTLRSQDNKVVYNSAELIPKKPGFFYVSLPPKSAPLITDQFYQWELKLTLKPETNLENVAVKKNEEISVQGWIQKADLSSSLGGQIKQLAPIRQAALYAENGLWYDALAILAKLRREKPQDLDIQKDWENILRSVDLDRLADKRFAIYDLPK